MARLKLIPPIREVGDEAMAFAIKAETSGGRDNGVTANKLDGIQYLIKVGWKRGKDGLPEPPMPCWRW